MGFTLEPDADITGTSLQSEILVAPSLLVKIYGEPESCDQYKISGEYSFIEDKTGKVVTLYDYKSTSLYDSSYVDPFFFWQSKDEHEFHIGAKELAVARRFRTWLGEDIERYLEPKQKPKKTSKKYNRYADVLKE